MHSKPPRDPSLSLALSQDLPGEGDGQAHPSCSHGALGSETWGFSLWSLEAAAGLTCQQGSKRP